MIFIKLKKGNILTYFFVIASIIYKKLNYMLITLPNNVSYILEKKGFSFLNGYTKYFIS